MWSAIVEIIRVLSRHGPGWGLAALAMILVTIISMAWLGGEHAAQAIHVIRLGR